MRPLIRLCLFLAISHAVPATAQSGWQLTLERGATAFSAAAHDTSAEQVQIRPWHPSLYSLRLARDGKQIGMALTISYSAAPLGANIGDFVLLTGDDAQLLELAPEVRLLVVRTANETTLRAHLGPVIDIWTPDGDDTRTVLGGLGGLTLSLPITGRWRADLRGDLAVTGSLLTKDEGSDEIIRESTMRRGRLGIGITRRL